MTFELIIAAHCSLAHIYGEMLTVITQLINEI